LSSQRTSKKFFADMCGMNGKKLKEIHKETATLLQTAKLFEFSKNFKEVLCRYVAVTKGTF